MVFHKKSIDTTLNFGAKTRIFKKAEMLRKKMTIPEKKFWDKLRENQLKGYKFRRQHPIDIFVVDFYCHKAKLVIEIDGESHTRSEIMNYDEGRTIELQNLGLKVIRFSNDQVNNDIYQVLKEIENHL